MSKIMVDDMFMKINTIVKNKPSQLDKTRGIRSDNWTKPKKEGNKMIVAKPGKPGIKGMKRSRLKKHKKR